MAKLTLNSLLSITLICLVGMLTGCESSSSSSGSSLGEPGEGGGFLWKPVSESDGKLVVLLPHQYRRRIEYCHIVNADGGLIEEGRFVGDTHNGDRAHYRFNNKGADYGNDIYVIANIDPDGDAQLVHWFIPAGANRTTY